MIDRIKFAKVLLGAGLYEWRPLLVSVAGIASTLTVLAALQPGLLPAILLPYHPQIVDVGKWAIVVVGLCGGILSQSTKAVLPTAPAPSAPSLLDDESGA